MSFNAAAQKTDSTVYTDIHLASLTPFNPSTIKKLDSGTRFIRLKKPGHYKKQLIGYKYSSTGSATRKAKWKKTRNGYALHFNVLKVPGYECVIIFCDKDFIYNSLLVKNDTLCFKQVTDDLVTLRVVYAAGKDSLLVREGVRSTRLDFQKKIRYNPSMENFSRWFDEDMLDYDHIYLLVKNGTGYRVADSDLSSGKLTPKDKEISRNKFTTAGSAFWVALTGMSFY